MHGQGHADASAISYLALTVWAYEELVHGVKWFMHLAGLAYVISTAVHLALALIPRGLTLLSRAVGRVRAYAPLMSGSGEIDGSLRKRVGGRGRGRAPSQGSAPTALVSVVAAAALVVLKLGTGLVVGSLGLVSAGIESSRDVVVAQGLTRGLAGERRGGRWRGHGQRR